ncbi:ead/Ea22-like family protein [Klebsiella variicola subsp. variicola]|uniref:ead/Ea22-like family protein n=1 Tax=Klebsiella variicola TaxID=244366 RepID=UPI00292B22C0|nr:ead/Ea22-like family protein [Klebsiella variicola]MDV0624574.1 ead/Ea22-like family protein [Klebsiella variicola subsp. variicola]
MTDITELAQSWKTAAHKAKQANDLYLEGKITLSECVVETKDYLDYSDNPNNFLALVEALEYYKSREERVTSLVRDNSKSWDELYRQVEAKGKRNVELVEALESEKRICATWRKTAESTSEKLEKAQAAERRWHRVASRVHEQACESDVKIDELEAIRAAAEKLVRCKGRYHSEQNYRALAALFGVKTPDLPPLEHENVHYADAAEMEIAALRQRIAKLESRTVKLPSLNPEMFNEDVMFGYRKAQKEAVDFCVAAGIKVEAE